MRINNIKSFKGRLFLLLLILAFSGLGVGEEGSPVIPVPDYTPPETVQRVALPVQPAKEKIRLLIITGENSYEHDWTGVNNLLRYQLQKTGLFDVRIIEDFSAGMYSLLQGYDVVLVNYLGVWNYGQENEKRWGAAPEKALFDYARNGGGVVIYHAALNIGAPSWPDWERLAGGTMRPQHGSRRSPPGAFMIRVVDRDHPVTRGMREYFWTFNDDMYTNMYWHPDADVRVLATAFDSSDNYKKKYAGPKYPHPYFSMKNVLRMEGMNEEHPQVWTVDYGEGRVICIAPGHGPDTLQFDGVKGLIARGAEWAATGEVTIPLEEKVKEFMD